jgi:hypothetical protein
MFIVSGFLAMLFTPETPGRGFVNGCVLRGLLWIVFFVLSIWIPIKAFKGYRKILIDAAVREESIIVSPCNVVQDKLNEIESLYTAGKISDVEHEALRANVLERLT